MKPFIILLTLPFLVTLQLSANTDAVSDTPAFSFPVVQEAVVISEFGPRTHPVLKTEHPHSGVDFQVAIGDFVVASAAGVVHAVDGRGTYGKRIDIEHPGGYITRYAHLSEFYGDIKAGDVVEAGQLIAFAGNTGMVAEPVLHFELLKEGAALDPLRYLQ
ncbi:MAG: M23 family metallopeptidase [Balneolaceae bacterium]